jgi:hypothetical protein
MRSAEFRELGIVKRLRAEAGSIHSQTAKRAQLLALHFPDLSRA